MLLWKNKNIYMLLPMSIFTLVQLPYMASNYQEISERAEMIGM